MNVKKCLCLLGLCIILLGSYAHAQFSMDVKVEYDASADAGLVSWYPGSLQNITDYVVKGYAADGTLLSTTVVSSPATSTILNNVLASGIEKISVTGLDAAGAQVETTPLEDVAAQLNPVKAAPMASLSTSSCGLGVTLESFDSGAFPMLYATVKVTNDGNPINYLTGSEFKVYEDGVLQEGIFDVTPPGTGGGVRIADIVFLIDTSGSMGGEIAAVKNNCVAFADALSASDIDYRLGLVQFGNSSYYGSNPQIKGGGLTSDAEIFKGWVTSLYASGSYEPGYQAINLAIQNYNFRTGAQKVFILITDEDSDGSLDNTVNLVTANQVTVNVAASCYSGNSQNHYCGTGSIRDISGGLLFDVFGDYTHILYEIQGNIANTYIVQYKSSTPECNGTTRNVDIVVNDPNDPTCEAIVSTSYTSCGAPVITRTADTLALHDISHLENSNLTIAAEVVDYVTPFVQGVTLYVRSTGSTNWTEMPMIQTIPNIYSAQIPASLVIAPGVEYYIRATDGEVTAADPSNEPENNPYQLAVLPNEPTLITHNPPAEITLNSDCDLTVSAEDDTDGVTELSLYYRVTGQLLWKKIEVICNPIVAQITDVFTIPQSEIAGPSMEYYIKAVDNYGVSSYWSTATADTPHILQVIENQYPIAVCQDITIESCGQYVSVDDGSYDLDGDPITIVQIPDGPYPLGTTEVTLVVTDDSGLSDQCTAIVTLLDITSPEILSVSADATVVPVNQTVTFSADSYDTCDPELDLIWNYDDGTAATTSSMHAFGQPGIYEVTLTATDDSGNQATASIIIVVYDPSGGFVSGGGTIDSPAGAYRPDVTLTGKANFGFISKYQKGKTTPTGQTEFQFKTAELNFHSSSYEWLVVNKNGQNAQFKGSGSINGQDGFKFMLWAIDADIDAFRIRIWQEEAGVETDVYDNNASQAILSGSIVMHTKK